MFVRVTRLEGGMEFSLVELAGKRMETVLVLGQVRNEQLERIEAWYGLAESLVNSGLATGQKRAMARELAAWLPPLTIELLHGEFNADLAALRALAGGSMPDLSGTHRYAEDDPLVIIARWLE